MLRVTVFILVLSVVAQIGATGLAVAEIQGVARRHRLAWICIALALGLMVANRVMPLELAVRTGLYDFRGAVLALIASLLLLLGMAGLRRLLADFEAQRRDLENIAATDPLTGLFNRRHLFERAAEEVLRAQRCGEPLALIMVDVDHFKQVNDRHGHAVGDALLAGVADAIRRTLRRVDIAGRLGGDEFAILLPNTDAASASIAADRLRTAIATGRSAGEIHVRASVGVAMAQRIPAGSEPASYFKDLLQEADTALYVAKERGRDRVEFWSAEMAIQAS